MKRETFVRTGILASALLLASSCVSFRYASTWREEPIDVEAELTPGSTTLDQILALHGAPNFVRPGAKSGMWLIWAWAEKGGWEIQLSYPVEQTSASIAWQEDDEDIQGLALLLDQKLVLVRRAEGRLSDILRGVQDPQRERRTGRSGLRRTKP